MGKGTEISIKNDSWISDLNYASLSSHFTNLRDYKVAELIDDSNRKWKKDLIESTFPVEISEKIPLAKEPHDDFLA